MEFNGLKYKPDFGGSASPEVVAELEKNTVKALSKGVKTMPFEEAVASGAVTLLDPLPSYCEQLGRMVDLSRLRGAGLKVAHEAMYGAGAGLIARVLDSGSTTVTELHGERNPGFGGMHPEPIDRYMPEAMALMGERHHDVLLAHDGDADRVGIIDETGRFIDQLQVYALLMRYLIETRGWKGPVVKSINMTYMADRLAERYGVPVYEVPVGFKNIAPKMMEVDAVLGGEESGGFGIRGHIPERDGILAGLYFADMIVKEGKPLSEILATLESQVGPHAYARHDIKMPRETYENDRRRVLSTLEERAPRTLAGRKVDRVRDDDGFKFYLDDGSWVLLRTSGTEPLIRVYSEAGTPEDVDSRLAALEEVVGIGESGGA
jgi:phosphomannomutase